MKKGIHPTSHKCVIKCSCGNTFETASVKENLSCDSCSACHPFYLGTQKTVATGGRADKFRKKYNMQ